MNKKINILIVGSDAPCSLERMYKRAFEAIGITSVRTLELRPSNFWSSQNRFFNRATLRWQYLYAEKRLINYLKTTNGKPDLIIVFKGMELSRKGLETARSVSKHSIWVNINPDDPYNTCFRGSSNQNVIDSLSFYDVYCLWAKGLMKKLEESQCKQVIHLPFGFDKTYHRLKQEKNNLTGNDVVSFVGAWDKERENFIENLTEFHLKIYGVNWNRVRKNSSLRTAPIVPKNIFSGELVEAMAESLVSINMLRTQNLNYHNMRTFEIPAMRTLMLSRRSDEQLEYFQEGVEAEYYSSPEELKDKLNFYVRNTSAAFTIGEAGYERCVRAGYSYEDRAQYLLGKIL